MPNFPSADPALPESFADATAAATTHPDAHNDVNDEVNAIGSWLRAKYGASDGLATLDSTTKVPTAQLGTGTANSTTFLRGDRTWGSGSVGALDDLSDVVVAGLATSQELIARSSDQKLFNIIHRYRTAAWQPAGDGTTDDSTALTAAIDACNASTNGPRVVEFTGAKHFRAKNLPIYSGITYDLGGSRIELPDSAGADADIFRVPTFDTLIAGNTTGGALKFTIRDGFLDGNWDGTGNSSTARHGIAAYGVGKIFNVDIGNCGGSGIYLQWKSSPTSSDHTWQLTSGALPGDMTSLLDNITVYNCKTRVQPENNSLFTTISGVTNTTNPTITTTDRHHLMAGQTITIANVNGATGVNGTRTVLAIVDANNFTITLGSAPGVFSASGSSSITWAAGPMIYLKNGDSPQLGKILAYHNDGNLWPGSVGMWVATPHAQGGPIHIYQNLHVGLRLASSGHELRVYIGGQHINIDQRANETTLHGTTYESFANGTGLAHRSVGGSCQYFMRTGPFTNGARHVQWASGGGGNNTVFITSIGDGGTNTSTLYTGTPPATNMGHHINGGFGLNASPATWQNP